MHNDDARSSSIWYSVGKYGNVPWIMGSEGNREGGMINDWLWGFAGGGNERFSHCGDPREDHAKAISIGQRWTRKE